MERSPLPDAEKAAIRFAEKVTTSHAGVTDEDIRELRRFWETDQIVELTCVAGLFNYLNRFAEALALEPTKPREGGPDGKEGEAKGE